MKRKLTGLFLIMLLLAALLTVSAYADSSGTCGDNVTWSLNEETGTLTITGSGPMTDYSDPSDLPWYYIDDIRTVVIENGVTSIGDYSFWWCLNLTNVTIPDSVTSIGCEAFDYTPWLESLGDFATVNGMLLRYQGSETEITIPVSVSCIGNYAFCYCSSLTSVTIPDSVTSIGDDAFYRCRSLTSVVIGNGVTNIGADAFYDCSSLTSVVIGNGVTSIGDYEFCSFRSLKSVVIGNGVTSIGEWAFSSSGLTEITFVGDAPSIGYGAFMGCTATAYYPCSNDTWTEEVMKHCSGHITWTLAHIPEEDSGTIINPTCTEKGYTTYTCSICGESYQTDYTDALGHVVEEDSGITINPTCTEHGYTTYTCSTCGESYQTDYTDALEHEFKDGICIRCGIDGIAAGTCGDNLTWVLKTDGTLVISGTGDMADYNYNDVPEAAYAPWYSKTVTSVVIENGVTSIGRYAFYNCSSLASVLIPDSVTSIGTEAFLGCSSLSVVTFKGNAPSITPGAFYGCTITAYYPAGNETWTEDVMQNYSGTITWVAYVPAHTHSYKATVTDPTCTEQGYTTYTCTQCGVSYTDTPTAALGHTWNSGKLTQEMTDEQDGIVTYTCTICGDTKTTILPAGGSPFVDVQKESRYYYAPVLWAVESGITNGTNAFTFSPDADCTREQVVTFLWRAAGSPEPTITGEDTGFTDLPKSTSGYYKAILWGYETGIVKGTSSTTFGYKKTVTRAQFVTFLWRFAGQPEPTITGSDTPFEDLPKSTSGYYKAILWAYENGVTTGDGATTFKPNKVCTRGQVVTFLYRYCYEGKGKTE